MSRLNKIDPFELEKKRNTYAVQENYEDFLKLYSNNLPEIPNKNSTKLWNKLNYSYKTINNYIALDRNKIIANFIRKQKGNTLNIGFGSGILEKTVGNKHLSRLNWNGIDISNKSVKSMKKNFPGNYKSASVYDIPFAENKFDVVIACEVLEHISPSKIFRALTEMHRITKKEGILVVSVPINEGLKKLIENRSNFNAHVRDYTLDVIKCELKLSGFNTNKVILLTAFRNHYQIKKLINNLFNFKKPNNLILIAQKK